MKDTSEDMLRVQREIFTKKSITERVKIGCELIDFGRKIIEDRIRKSNPNITIADLNVEIFRQRYTHIFSPEILEAVALSMRNYFSQKKS